MLRQITLQLHHMALAVFAEAPGPAKKVRLAEVIRVGSRRHFREFVKGGLGAEGMRLQKTFVKIRWTPGISLRTINPFQPIVGILPSLLRLQLKPTCLLLHAIDQLPRGDRVTGFRRQYALDDCTFDLRNRLVLKPRFDLRLRNFRSALGNRVQ